MKCFTTLGLWLLLPVTAVQGLLLRQTAIRLSPPKVASRGSVGEGGPIHLLAAGDSIIAGVGASHQHEILPLQFASSLAAKLACRVEWNLLGTNGADIEALRQQLKSLDTDSEADVILISIGVNDVTGLTSKNKWREQLQMMMKQIRKQWPGSLVIFAGLPPMARFPLLPQPLRSTLGKRAGLFDTIAKEMLTTMDKVLHIPTEISPDQAEFCADGFHPSSKGYRIWGEQLAEQAVLNMNQTGIFK